MIGLLIILDDRFIWNNHAKLYGGELVFDFNTFGVKKLAQRWVDETFDILGNRIKKIKVEWTENPFYPNGQSLGYKQFWDSYLETGDEILSTTKTTFYETINLKGFSIVDKVFVESESVIVILK